MKAFSCLTLIALAGCSAAPPQSTPVPPARVETPSRAEPKPAPPAPAAVAETENQRLGRLIAGLKGRSVFFRYDDFSVDGSYDDLLRQHAEVVKNIPRGSLAIEGNADERGSKEYNLALGQKRAEAVRKLLLQFGVPEARLEAISFGEENPLLECHEERCWSQNRRVDFDYRTK